jgi:hypothetical protein
MKDSWIVDFWSNIFWYLGKLSLFTLIRAIGGRPTSYAFVDLYVMANALVALATLIIASLRHAEPVGWLLIVFVCYGVARVFEIVVYQVNVLLFDEYRAFQENREYKVRSFRRLVLLLLHNYLEVLCWFGVFYLFFYRSGDLKLTQPVEFFTIFRESLLMMIAFSPERNDPTTALGVLALTVHSFVGIFMTVIVLARFLALLPAPASRDDMDNRKH